MMAGGGKAGRKRGLVWNGRGRIYTRPTMEMRTNSMSDLDLGDARSRRGGTRIAQHANMLFSG